LRLTKTQTHAAINGISNVNTATDHSVAIHLKSKLSDRHTTFNCAILPNITGVAPSPKLHIGSWKLHKDIKLGDEKLYQPGSIDLLIGVDIYFMRLFEQLEEHVKATFQFTRNHSWLDNLWVHPSCHTWATADIPASRRQQIGAKSKPLLGSGNCGVIHHVSRATSL
jgi:hypothetical protein